MVYTKLVKAVTGRTLSNISWVLAALVLMLFIVSCSEAGVLMPNMERVDEAEILTAPDGEVFMAGGDVGVQLYISDSSRAANMEAVQLQVYLYADDQIAQYEFDEQTLNQNQLLSVVLPDDLEVGYYELRYRLYQHNRVVASHAQGFFVADTNVSPGGISVYPSRFEPDSQGILQVSVQTDETSGNEPYAVWRFDSKIVAHGRIADGFDEVLIRSPDREGVYSVLVDLYPAPPRDGIPFPFGATSRRRGEVVVTSSPPVRQHELQPASSYYSLLRLNGNLRDIGQRTRDHDGFFRAEGSEPELVIEQERLGHRFSGNDVIVADASVLPRDQNRFLPFTITVRGRFTESEQREVWVKSEGAAWAAEIFSKGGLLTARLSQDDEELQFQVDRSIIPDDESSQWSFSFFTQEDSVYGMWLVNGILMRAESLPLLDSFREDENAGIDAPTTRIGFGVHGVIEEIGVYYQDETGAPSFNTGEFRQAMELSYPHTLIYATGFTGETNEQFSHGSDVIADAGYLLIPPGENVHLPDVLFNDGDVIFELLFGDEIVEGVGMLRFDGFAAGTRETLLSMDLSQEMQVQVGAEQERLVIRGEPDLQSDELPAMTGVTAVVENQSDQNAVLRLRHVLARNAERNSNDPFFAGRE